MIPNGFQEQEMELPENEILKRCSPLQPSAQICACFSKIHFGSVALVHLPDVTYGWLITY